jgi:iron complex outermembrane recepter protein
MKRVWLATSALALSFVASAALAQEGNVIEEVVVTAEKREQSLQDVPVAVSAFTDERRDLIGITTIQDMTNFTPGLQYSSQLDRASLRGVGRLTNVHAAEGAVAVYSDGIFTTSTVEAGKPPIFTDRVEVLRGPQGTLYGRNAIGGAINVISKRPTEDWYAEVRGVLGNYDRYQVMGAMSGPTMIPGVNFRVAAAWEKQNKGWIENIVPGMPDEGNVIDTRIYEAQLSFQPNERFDGWVKLAMYEWMNDGGGPGSRYTWTPAPFPTYSWANAAIVLNPGYGCHPGGIATNVANVNPLGCVNPAVNDPRKIASTVAYDVDLDKTWIFASEWNYHFDNMTLKYVLGGTRYDYDLSGPTPVDQTAPIIGFNIGAFAVRPRYQFHYSEQLEWLSHELNLASTHEGPFQWLVGAYAYHEHYVQPVYTQLTEQPQASGPAPGACTQPGFGGVCPPNTLGRIYDNRPVLDIETKAIYGQIDWEFAEGWKTTVGLRYTDDKKYGHEELRLLCFAVPTCVPVAGFLLDLTGVPTVVSAPVAPAPLPPGVTTRTTFDPATGLARREYEAEWDAVTGTAGVQWDPDPDSMYYARYSRGYKAGGFRIGIDTVLGASPLTDEETADAFEIGMKKNFFANQLQVNAALFHYEYQNAQVPLTVAATAGGLAQAQSIFYNIPESISQGLELETVWQPIDNLQILFNYSYLNAEVTEAVGAVDPADPAALDPQATPVVTTTAVDVFTQGLPGGGFQRGQDLDGNNLPNAPKHKLAVNANYTWDFGMGSLTASATYIWRDEQYGSIFNRSYYKSPDYDQVDARITWKDADDRYTVIAFVRNVFDEIGYEGGAGANRRAGFLFNPVTPYGGAPTPVLQGISSTYPLTPPRTYGIELQYRFF